MPRNTRRSLKAQGNAVRDIGNFVRKTLKRPQVSAKTLIQEENVNEVKKSKEVQGKEVQVNLDIKVDASDLTKPDKPSGNYWRLLAEKTQITLHKTLEENEELRNTIEEQKKDIDKYKRMLEEANAFIEMIRGEFDSDDTGIDVNDVSTADESQLTNESIGSDKSAEI